MPGKDFDTTVFGRGSTLDGQKLSDIREVDLMEVSDVAVDRADPIQLGPLVLGHTRLRTHNHT